MIKVESNESLRNVAQNALAGMELLRNSVFFGVNGAGKSTVCEALSQYATLSDDRLDPNESLTIFAFNDRWRRDKVGDFIEGGSAKGVTTVKMDDDAGTLEEDINQAKTSCDAAKSAVKSKSEFKTTAEKRQKEIIDQVAAGVRKSLEHRCPDLSGKRFKRPAIRALLEDGRSQVLSSSEVDEQLVIATSLAPGFLPNLPHFPETWTFSDHLWEEVCASPSVDQETALTITDWIREGVKTHRAGDLCHFCSGAVTAERIAILESAILQIEEGASSLIKEELEECSKATYALRKFIDALEGTDLTTSIYNTDLHAKKTEVLLEAGNVLTQIEAAQALLTERVKNPQRQTANKPAINFSSLEDEYISLKRSHSAVQDKITKHSHNQKKAIELLKRHCCATDGAGWDDANQLLAKAEAELQEALQAEKVASEHLDDLNRRVSTTADTAEFIDSSLALILGERNLRVSEGQQGEGYRITRHDQKAEGMSEGEKKLVALLYFCAEFRTEERKQLLKNSVIIFDDLGSELDEPRLLAVDRFITNHFQNPNPASIVYFTHSHTYLRILQSRLGGRAVETEQDGKIKPPSAVFYEIYKDGFSGNDQSTTYRKWDDQAVKLTNDYWLSFYMVLQAFDALQNQKVPSLGTGNFCRKVLEGFTEFRAPGNDQFGIRIDKILSDSGLSLSPALSKVVNGLSHSDLLKAGGVLSRNEMEHAVVQTLNLMREVDRAHFFALLVKFKGKKEAENTEKALQLRVGDQLTTKA